MHGQINELSQGFVAFLGDFCDKKCNLRIDRRTDERTNPLIEMRKRRCQNHQVINTKQVKQIIKSLLENLRNINWRTKTQHRLNAKKKIRQLINSFIYSFIHTFIQSFFHYMKTASKTLYTISKLLLKVLQSQGCLCVFIFLYLCVFIIPS